MIVGESYLKPFMGQKINIFNFIKPSQASLSNMLKIEIYL